MPPRVVQFEDVPGVGDAIRTGDPTRSGRAIREILAAGGAAKDVAGTAAFVAATHCDPSMPPHALLALGASLDLVPETSPMAVAQACALAAHEWRPDGIPVPRRAVSGDELHLAASFLVAVRGGNAEDADMIFAGLLREGEERRLAGDALFEACGQDAVAEGHKLTLAVGHWRLARALGWVRGPVLMRPAVRFAASGPQDLAAHGAILRDVGRSRLDLELAGRNVAPIDAVARNGYEIALGVGPDRLVSEMIEGLKRGRTPAGYADLVCASALDRLVEQPAALEPALHALAMRFVVGFSRSPHRVLSLLTTARTIARLPEPESAEAPRIGDPAAALNELEIAIEGDDAGEAAGLARGLAGAVEPDLLASVLHRQAALEDAFADSGHRLLLAAWATELAAVAPGPAFAAIAATLARAQKSRTVSEA